MKMPAAPALSIAMLLTIALLPLSGCKWMGYSPTGGTSGGTLGSPVAVDANPLHLPDADIAMQAKLQSVIQCINRSFKHYEEIEPAYHKRIAEIIHPVPPPGPYAAPVIPSGFDFFEFKIEPYEQNGEFATACAKGLDTAVAASPADPAIDQPARDAAQALRAILEPGSEMDAYLSQKAYVNDNFAKGRALDATLTPLLNRLVDDSTQLRAAVGRQEDTLRQHRLDAIDKAEGHSLEWHTQACMLQARALNANMVKLVRAKQLNADSAAAATRPLQDAYNDTEAYLAKHPEAGRPNRYNNQPLWFSIDTGLSSELRAANELRQALGDRTLTPEGQRQQVNQQLEQITASFNQLIDTYNMMAQNTLR